MAEIIENLLDLQDLDVKLTTMERETTNIPARKNAITAQLDSFKASIAEAEETVKAEQLALKGIEADIEAAKAKIAKFREQQMSLKSNEEFRAMEHRILGVENEISRLEDSQLAKYDEIEAASTEVKERQGKLSDQESRIQGELDELDERKNYIESEIESIRSERASLAEGVDHEWLHRYEMVLKSKKNSALVPISKNCVCGGCHMQIPPQLRQDAKRQEEIVSCTYCGRMLYVDM